MGLKNKLSKMKSFLFDEEEEVVKKVPKKPVKQEQILEESFSDTAEIEELYFEDEKKDVVKENTIKSRTIKNESEFKFPEFDDDDFLVSKVKQEQVVQIPKEEKKPLLYQGSKRKEETKKFKPSPIISPIYGLLDKEGNTVKKEVKTFESKSYKEEPSLESVRKKAYGTLEEDLESTMKRLSKKTIEEAEKDMEDEEKRISKASRTYEQDAIVISKNDEDDDMLLPNVNFKEIDVDIEKDRKLDSTQIKEKETKENFDDEDDEDTKEQDLFKLIDSMYQKEGDEK